jgi:hypothetical protein
MDADIPKRPPTPHPEADDVPVVSADLPRRSDRMFNSRNAYIGAKDIPDRSRSKKRKQK